MRESLMIAFLTLFCLVLAVGGVMAQDPVKWSAPMNQYPEQWSPSPAPPQYNPYGYSYYPYGAYGYGGDGQNQAYSYGYPAPAQQYGGAYSGNPYYGYYGR